MFSRFCCLFKNKRDYAFASCDDAAAIDVDVGAATAATTTTTTGRRKYVEREKRWREFPLPTCLLCDSEKNNNKL